MAIDKDKCLFSEIQRFRQKWIWFIVLIIAGVSWWAFFQQIILRTPFGDNPTSNIVIWVIFIIFGIGLPWLFLSLKLETGVREDHIHIRFRPLASRTIYRNEIKTYGVREYRPLAEFGGWGIRWSSKHGMAYNVSGKRGVQLELINGKKVLIGSQKPEDFERALRQMLSR